MEILPVEKQINNNHQRLRITDLNFLSNLSNNQTATLSQVHGGAFSQVGNFLLQDAAQTKQTFFPGVDQGYAVIALLPRPQIPVIYRPDPTNPAVNPTGQNQYGPYALTASGFNQISISYQ
ncbi:hypothetical protein H6F89_28860 [Cyanobacteria bacterium FACHB-63]|nr:hypothetical protein [Cyanobacteria bacterium FACHB-63]